MVTMGFAIDLSSKRKLAKYLLQCSNYFAVMVFAEKRIHQNGSGNKFLVRAIA